MVCTDELLLSGAGDFEDFRSGDKSQHAGRIRETENVGKRSPRSSFFAVAGTSRARQKFFSRSR
jgi:hypothetical protein